MKRQIVLYLLMLAYLTANSLAVGQVTAKLPAKPVCPFSIVGLWKLQQMTERTQTYFDFAPEGSVTLLGYAKDALPQDFEMLTSVTYTLDTPETPKHVVFTADRGNDAFPVGTTVLEITAFGDDHFTTRNPATGEQGQWMREQTRLYFLTFAARIAAASQNEPVFVMWTLLDGRQAQSRALGVYLKADESGQPAPVFGEIPAELYEQVAVELRVKDKKREKTKNIIVRFEMTQAEYEATDKIFETWNRLAEQRELPQAEPYQNALEFLVRTADQLTTCGNKEKLYKPGQRERDNLLAKYPLSQRPLEYIRELRKKNTDLHLSDLRFPWSWRPIIQPPGT